MVDLGRAIHARRGALSLTLNELAERAHVSRAMLSDIERGAKTPSIRVVCQIAEALDTPVSRLLGEQPAAPEAISVARAADQRRLIDPHSGVERRLLAPAFLRRGIEVVWYVIPPGQKTDIFPAHRHGVAEQITVIQGRLRCYLGAQEVTLDAGDSVAFNADVPHDFHNVGPEPCHYLLLIDSAHTE
jgi:transcriptional regulator with XRE-family HTH domain